VLFISSGAARRTIGGLAVYSATKRGAEQFFEVLAAQYADDPHVRVVNVDPGSVDTDMQAQLRTDARCDVYFPAGGLFVGMHERGELVGSSDAARQILTTHLSSN
jgi:benzil reductase ((S)-benzoin forming)